LTKALTLITYVLSRQALEAGSFMPAIEEGNFVRTIIVLLGSPGSGKGTQAALLRKLVGMPHISTGTLLRDQIIAGTELGKAVEACIKSGALVSNETVNSLVEQRTNMSDCKRGFILDGYPRTVEQARWLRTRLSEDDRIVAIDIDVNVECLIARLQCRVQCVSCPAVYNLATDAPRAEGVCDQCGGTLIHRDDDREEIVRARFSTYTENNLPLVQYFTECETYFCVNGMRTVREISAEIEKFLEESLHERSGTGRRGKDLGWSSARKTVQTFQ
jgi:adenylate kinase